MAKAVLTCDMVSKRSQDSGFSLVYTPNALPGKNSPTANKHMGKCFDRVKLATHRFEVITPARARKRAGNQGCKDLLPRKHNIVVWSILTHQP